jgi:hypothetical protein
MKHDEGPALWIDCEGSEELTTQRTLLTLALPGLIGWEGPRRSLGTRGEDRRSVFVGTFMAPMVSELDLRLYIKALQNRDGLAGVLVGSRSLFNDKSTFLVDMGHPRAIAAVSNLVDEVVLVSPKLAIMSTSKSAEAWCSTLTEQFKVDPSWRSKRFVPEPPATEDERGPSQGCLRNICELPSLEQ